MVRQVVEEIKAYHVEEQIGIRIRLDANESPYNLPVQVADRFAKVVTSQMDFNRYPDNNATALRESIAKNFGVDTEQCIIGVGSDQLIDCALRMSLDEGDKVLIPEPSFSMYKLSTTLNHGGFVTFPLENFQYNVNSILKMIQEEAPEVVILCTPNNPTGTIITVEDICKVLEAFNGLVIVDEAYGEFITDSAVKLINQYKNLLVLRTFSKAYGAAGLRLGYGLGDKELIGQLDKVRPPYNVNALTQVLGKMIMDGQEYFVDRINNIKAETKRIYEAFKVYSWLQVVPTHANFLFVMTDQIDLYSEMKKEGILIRAINKEKNWYRISIGLKEENDQVLRVMKRVGEERGN